MHYHPICHYLRGERLYYLLITVETSAEFASANVEKALSDVRLNDRACAYWLFGDTDIIIRVWSSESAIIDLEEHIRKAFNNMERPVRRLLVSSMETWYQRQIESKPGWSNDLRPENSLRIIEQNPPAGLRYDCGPSDSRIVLRYFILIREPSAKNKKLFKELSTAAKRESSPMFRPESRISLYSIYSRDFNGVILKGETTDFSATAQHLVEFASAQKKDGRETTTYICSRNLRKESNALGLSDDSETGQVGITRNLLLSEECNAATLQLGTNQLRTTRTGVSDLFVHIIRRELHYVFFYHEGWWPYIKDLRYLYKWVIFADNEQLMAFLTRHYALCENELCSILKDDWKRQCDSKKIEREKAANTRLKNFLLRSVVERWVFDPRGSMRMTFLRNLASDDRSPIEARISNGIKEEVTKLSESFPPDIISGIRGCLQHGTENNSDETNMTMGSIALFLETTVRVELTNDAQKILITEFASRLRECGNERNRVVHGAIGNFFEKVYIEKQREFAWQRPVSAFIKMRLLYPHVIPILKDWKRNKILPETGTSPAVG
ncbi:MAG TPA: hypothetical protein VGM54_05600 [Chthoniobacter sp.]|jgi:hypothetical protein